ncbi:MAG: tRNA uridine(34) 5-carboxymethylaminomethyl modification radical SAM/GNAT enzyme Elp3 [Candidatus Nanoarchaeia archaeon]
MKEKNESSDARSPDALSSDAELVDMMPVDSELVAAGTADAELVDLVSADIELSDTVLTGASSAEEELVDAEAGNIEKNLAKNLKNAELKNFLSELIVFIREKSPSKLELSKKKVLLCRSLKMKKIPTDIELLLNVDDSEVFFLKKFLQTKPMRTGSGVAVVAVMSAPGKCPHGKCIYCPGGIGSAFGDVPQSYTGNEPATMRGMRNNYDSYLQVMNRLEQYVAIGQSPEKVELIILGGTFLAFSEEYQDSFIRDIYQAMNDFSEEFYGAQENKENSELEFNLDKFKNFFELPGDIRNKERTNSIRKKLLELKDQKKKTLAECKSGNEKSMIRCVGLTIETKPDWGFLEHGNRMLEYGCTRVELGIQTLDDNLLKKINRGHNLEDSKRSIKELKNLGFKLNFHMMPGLPGSNKEQDITDLKRLFEDSDFRPDMLKIYPTMVMPGTPLFEMYKKGKFAPLDEEEAVEIISEGLRYVQKYCRLMRIQRDIPAKFAEKAIMKNNLRQLVSQEVKKKGFLEQDIKAREIGNEEATLPIDFEIIKYESSGGEEYFISLVDSKDKLLGFVRLRFPSESLRVEITPRSAIIRELHVYGKSIPLGSQGIVQHKGFGKMLMARAEQIAKEHGKTKILVISGIGVREYYKKLGYELEGAYMVKLQI